MQKCTYLANVSRRRNNDCLFSKTEIRRIESAHLILYFFNLNFATNRTKTPHWLNVYQIEELQNLLLYQVFFNPCIGIGVNKKTKNGLLEHLPSIRVPSILINY